MSKYLAAEMCQTVNDHWGIGSYDINYKSPGELIESLCSCRKVGANYLLNIGPEAQGEINPYQEQLFALIGRWMQVYAEAIYNGRPYQATGVGRSFMLKSADGRYLYIFAYDLGICGDSNVTLDGKYSGSYSFSNVSDKISSVEWMDNGEKLDFVQKEDMLCVDLRGFEYGKSLVVRVAKAEIV